MSQEPLSIKPKLKSLTKRTRRKKKGKGRQGRAAAAKRKRNIMSSRRRR